MPGAMPWSHRWIGNPVLTGMLNLLFRTGVSDAHCGLRALRREALETLQLQSTGMEFASEMVIKAAKRGLRITEIPAQVIQLGLFARTYAVVYMAEEEPMLESLWRRFRLEHGLAVAAITLLAGIVITLVGNFDGVPDPALGLLGLTLAALGVQGIFGAFFLSILGLPQHAILRRQGSRNEPPHG